MVDKALNKLFTFDLRGKIIDADDTIAHAIQKMTMSKQNCLLVKKQGERAVGIISEHDVVTAFARIDKEAKKAKVLDYMTIDVVAIKDTDTIDEALKMMADNNVRHLPVITEEGTIVDFLSIMDLVLKKTALKE
jgi:CBS domain-containing protein